MNRRYATLTLIAALATIVLAQAPPPPAVTEQPSSAEPALRPIDESRHYRNQRERSLSRRERFENTGDLRRERAADEAYDRGYEDGFEEGFRAAQRNAAQARTESLYDAAVAQGMERFKSRNYGAALRNFMLAARSDQGDPASRMHAAHAMSALRHYEDAYLLARRAFQLQPQLVFVPLDIRRYYANRTEFDTQISHLRADAMAADTNPKLWALLGYFEFFSERHTDAHRSIKRAAELAPADRFVAALLDAARLSVPANGTGPDRKSH